MIALQAIATFNDRTMDIAAEDVQGGDSQPPPSLPLRDKKNSELPTPEQSYEGESERSPLPDFEDPGSAGLSRSGSRGSAPPRYDAMGVGPAPPKRQEPIRTGSAFYAQTPGVEDVEDGLAGHLRRSVEEEEEGLMNGNARTASGEKRGWRDWGRDKNWMSWWDSWLQQMGKLFVPQWRRTVLLMWVIWGSMSLGEFAAMTVKGKSVRADTPAYTMFNVWLPAVLESRASGEGDEAIKQALQEFVLYSGKSGLSRISALSQPAHLSPVAGCPGSIVRRSALGNWASS